MGVICERLRSAIGVWSEPGPASFPIDRSDIRRWAIAMHWPEEPPRQYWGEEYARTTRWGGIIAPDDFNPFAWPLARPTTGPKPYLPGVEPRQRMLNGGPNMPPRVPRW